MSQFLDITISEINFYAAVRDMNRIFIILELQFYNNFDSAKFLSITLVIYLP